MTRAFVIIAVWIALAALVSGVACLAHVGGERGHASAVTRLALAPEPAATPRVTLLSAPARSTPPSAVAIAQVQVAATTSAATSTQPAGMSTSATAVSMQTAGASPQEPPKKEPPPSRPAPQKPPAKPDPPDDEDDKSNHGLGRLPKGVPPEYEGLGVFCVSSATGRAIPDVKVRSLTAAELDEWAARNPGKVAENEDPETVLAASVTNAKTSASGITITPSGPGRMLVDARMGLLYGYTWVDRTTTSSVKLSMVEDHDAVFQTRGPDGATRAGVPVVVYDSRCTEIWRGVTQGDDATARMRHATFLIERDAAPGKCTARIEGVLRSSPAIQVPRWNLPVDNITLTLPATHSLRVHVKDPEGAPVREPVRVRLFRSQDGSPSCGEISERTTSGGEATFERVESGTGEMLLLTLDGGKVYSESKPAQVSGDKDVVDVAFTRRYPVAVLHLADAEGKPLAGARVSVDEGGPLAWDDPDAPVAPCVTAADGSLRVPIGHLWIGEGRPSGLLLVLRNDVGDSLASASVALDKDFASGERDLGTVQLKELPVIAQGYVLDDRDGVVAGARVHVGGSDDPAIALDRIRTDDRFVAVADTMGFFKLRGAVNGSRLVLSASAADHAPLVSAPVERGDKKVKVVLPRCGTLLGKLLLPPGLTSDSLTVQLGGVRGPALATIGQNDIYRAVGLAPGMLKLEVLVDGLKGPVFLATDVEVKPGVEVSDPRVVMIDMRDKLIYVTVHVTDADGKIVPDATVEITEPTDAGGKMRRQVSTHAGVASFAARKPSVDIEVRAPGFETLKLPGVDKDAEAQLVRAKR